MQLSLSRYYVLAKILEFYHLLFQKFYIKAKLQFWDIALSIKPKHLVHTFNFLKNKSEFSYENLVDIVAVDRPSNHLKFSLTYFLLSIKYNVRIQVQIKITKSEKIFSSTGLFVGANWLEREVWDLFGIYFLNHADLRRILTDYGFIGHPLRKDFPLMGYIELFYEDRHKYVNYFLLFLTQEFRNFFFSTSWRR